MKLQTIFSLLLVFVLLFQITGVVSQEKDKKKEDKRPRLELPDVLIYGTDTKIRLTGDKVQVPADSARLIKPYLSYEPLNLTKMVFGEKEFIQPGNQEKKLANEVLITYGSYNMADLRFFHWQKWTANDYGLGIQYHRSDGQYKDSQFDRLETTGRVSFRTSPVVKVRTEGTYVLHRYGLQGSKFRERNATAWNIKGLIPLYFSDQASGSLNLWYQDLSLSSGKEGTDEVKKVNNHFLKLSGEYLWVTLPYQLSLSALFLNDSFHFPADSSGNNFMTEIGAQVLFQPSQNFSTQLGLNLQNLSINQVSQTRVSPYGKIIYSHKSRWGFYLSASQGYDYQTYFDLWNKNYFIANLINLQPQEVRLLLEAGTEFKLSKGLLTRVSFSQRRIKDFGYWQRNSTGDSLAADGLFGYERLDKVRLSDLLFHLEWKPSEKFKIESTSHLYFYKISEAQFSYLPYQENYNSRLSVSYQPVAGSTLTLTSRLVGPRKIYLDIEDELAAFVILNLEFERNLNKHFFIFLTGNNLANFKYKYQLWHGYYETGIHLLGGIKGKW